MIVSTDPDYLDTKLIKQGAKELEPVLKELADWIQKKYTTPVLNIYCDKIDTDQERPRINIIFEYCSDVEKFRDNIGNYDTKKQNSIADQFRLIVKSTSIPNLNLSPELFTKVHSSLEIERLLVIFSAFEPIVREEINHKIPQAEIDGLKKALAAKNVWEIFREFATTTVFFETDKQIEDYRKSGILEQIQNIYFRLLKRYDEFDYIKHDTSILNFDSRENFEMNFESNWFYYSRR